MTDKTMKWFTGYPVLVQKEVRTFRVVWKCPQEGCTGEMIAAGGGWCTNPMGYWHTCNVCGANFALSGKQYPRIEHEEI